MTDFSGLKIARKMEWRHGEGNNWNLTGIHTALAKKELDQASVKIKEMTIDSHRLERCNASG